MKRESKERFIHGFSLSAEMEKRLKAQREKGRTITGLLILGLQEAEKKE